MNKINCPGLILGTKYNANWKLIKILWFLILENVKCKKISLKVTAKRHVPIHKSECINYIAISIDIYYAHINIYKITYIYEICKIENDRECTRLNICFSWKRSNMQRNAMYKCGNILFLFFSCTDENMKFL